MKDFIKKYVFEDYMDHLNQLSDDEREFFKQDTLEVFEIKDILRAYYRGVERGSKT